MDSFIFIDGIALWVLLACLAVIIIGIICLGESHIKVLKEIESLKSENDKLVRRNDKLEDKLYKLTFKTPEVEDVHL